MLELFQEIYFYVNQNFLCLHIQSWPVSPLPIFYVRETNFIQSINKTENTTAWYQAGDGIFQLLQSRGQSCLDWSLVSGWTAEKGS